MLEKQQFRILFREFLFNMIDLELLAPQAYGDMDKLLGQFAGFLLWLSAMLALGGAMTKGFARAQDAWGAEHSLIGLTMLIVGIFSVLSWDSALPNRRDVLVLAPLPIRVRTLFAAKVAALATALGMTVVSVNVLGCLGWAPHFTPDGAGFLGLLRTFAAYWLAMSAGGAFLFCCLLAVQGLAAQLPRQYFLRLSSLLQTAALAALLSGYFLEPPLGSAAATAFAPSYWFFALFHQLNGSMPASMAPAAAHAWTGLAIAVGVAFAAFLLSYFRTVKKIVEEPDLTPAVRGLSWLPQFGSPLATAITQFSIRTLMRSRQHRVILAFYLGVAFAIIALGARGDHGRQPNVSLMIGSVMLMAAMVVGMRVVFAMPIDLRANWIFRMTEIQPFGAYLNSSRRPLFVMAVAPVWFVSAAALFWFCPWQLAVRHLPILALWGAILAYVSLHHFQKIPFTCSYLPGKSQIHLAIIGAMALLMLATLGVIYEFGTFRRPAAYATLVAGMAVAALAARWWAVSDISDDASSVQFDESMPPAVMELHLRKDGFLPMH